MSELKHARLGDVVEITKGISYQGQFLTSDGLPLVNLKCIERGGGFRADGLKPYSGPYNDRHVVAPGDLVLANTDLTQDGGIIGCPAIVPALDHDAGFGLISHHLCRARAIDDATVDISFLYYIFRGPWFRAHAQGVASGTTVLGFRTDDIEAFELDLPPLPVQRRVARLLGFFDDLIEIDRRKIRILEEMARLVYREWFVHFRFPGHEDIELVDSDLGPIPAGWRLGVIGDLGEVVTGTTPPTKEADLYGELASFLTPSDMTGERFVETVRSLSHHGVQRFAGRMIPPGSVCFTCIGSIGKMAVASDSLLTNQQINSVVPSSRYSSGFIFQLLRDRSDHILSIAGGAATPIVNKSTFEAVEVILPATEPLSTFHRLEGPIGNLIDLLTRQSRVLSEARDLLLPRLISGDLDVSDLNLHLEPVA